MDLFFNDIEEPGITESPPTLNLMRENNTFVNFSYNNDTFMGFPGGHLSRKSVSLLGVIGGFILILLFMAFLTCIRQKKIYQGYVEPREPLHLYRVYCQLDGVFVVSVNTETQVVKDDVSPPDYESVVTADLEDLPNYDQVVQLKPDNPRQESDL